LVLEKNPSTGSALFNLTNKTLHPKTESLNNTIKLFKPALKE
jgi:hypothetical protein